MSAEEELKWMIFRMKMGIFLLGNIIFDVVFIVLLLAGLLDLFEATVVLIFISLLELQITVALWLYTAQHYQMSRPSLELLDEVAKRMEDILWLSTPIFEAIRRWREKFEWKKEKGVITVHKRAWWKFWEKEPAMVKVKCGFRFCPWDRNPPFKTCDRCPYGEIKG